MKKGISILFVALVALMVILAFGTPAAAAPPPPDQTHLPGAQIPQFVDPLPLLSVAGGPMETIIAGTDEITLRMMEFRADVMPSTFVAAKGKYTGTWVFGYRAGRQPMDPMAGTYVGPVIVATRGVPTQIKYINNLTTHGIAWRKWIDQSLHWANPLGAPMMVDGMGNPDLYTGPVPAVPHLHGGEVPAVLDGGPEAWFTSDGRFRGAAYYTKNDTTDPDNTAVYRYPNTQEAAPIWFHDHLLGATRINATFAGLAGAYAIIDPDLELPAGLHPVGLQNLDESNLRYTIPLVIQDRMFDTNGQLFFPVGGDNPEHPYWKPEFVGDTIVVNGKVWPYLNVDRQRYHFYLINGSNSVPYSMWLEDESEVAGPSMWVIATDGGYLDDPVEIDPSAGETLVMMPGERYEIIIDFAGVAAGTNLILRNNGETVDGFPDPGTTGRIMQFRVSDNAPEDTSYDPATSTDPLRPAGKEIVRLVDPATGTIDLDVTVAKTRLLTLNEVATEAGPLEALVNNSKWNGKRPDGTPIPDSTLVNGLWLTELPNEGDTEVWEFVNLTEDAHPIHLHGVQFQILNREAFDAEGYIEVYDGLFPGGAFIGGYGPPLNYFTGNPLALGGNPDITPFLSGIVEPPFSYEAGWKDTAIMPPGAVTRIVVRFAPQDKAINDGAMYFPYDPNAPSSNGQPGYYVWHCHITDHEDHEMMRPDQFVPDPDAVRTYIQGTDY